jgi:hypothetical protein
MRRGRAIGRRPRRRRNRRAAGPERRRRPASPGRPAGGRRYSHRPRYCPVRTTPACGRGGSGRGWRGRQRGRRSPSTQDPACPGRARRRRRAPSLAGAATRAGQRACAARWDRSSSRGVRKRAGGVCADASAGSSEFRSHCSRWRRQAQGRSASVLVHGPPALSVRRKRAAGWFSALLETLARVMEDAQAMGACRSLGRRRLPNVIHAKAGTHAVWVPAFAWMTPQAIGQSFGRLFIRQPRIATAGPAVVRPRASASIHRCETVRKARWSPPRPRHIVLTSDRMARPPPHR